MDIHSVGLTLKAAKGYIGAIVFLAAAYVALSSFGHVPAKLDAHLKQAEESQREQERTNRKLDVMICLQAKLDTPIRCVARERQ